MLFFSSGELLLSYEAMSHRRHFFFFSIVCHYFDSVCLSRRYAIREKTEKY